jgi:chemotaxis protein histidine kinase CheA
MSAKDPMNLDQLEVDFDIRGELSGRDDARVFLAKRRTDGRPVLISVANTPAGDRGNSLSHLAADARLLSSASHPHLLPVVSGQWVGTDAFAIVTERPSAPTLEELLARREEAFGFPRIAAILRQISAVIEWSRAQKVVHRALRLDTIHVEPGSDHVRVLFAVSALDADGVPGQREDAATIARLARAMLTRSPIAPEREQQPLAELRPGLPKRVIEETDALLSAADDAERPFDVSEYIASIAMAEEIKQGEDEYQRVIAEMADEARVTREQLAAERLAHEADLAEQARAFQREKEETAKAFAAQKEQMELALAEEREGLHRAIIKEREELHRAVARDQEELQRTLRKEREDMERAAVKARAELEKERKRFAKERAALAKERAAFERFSKKSREQVAAKLAALESHSLLYEKTAELPVADRELTATVAREQDWRPDSEDAQQDFAEPELEEFREEPDEPYDELVDEPEPAYTMPALSAPTMEPGLPHPVRPPWWQRVWRTRSRRITGLAAVALVGLIGAAALALGRDNSGGTRTRLIDSAAGAVEQPILLRNLTPTTTVDSGLIESEPPPRRITEPREDSATQAAPPPANAEPQSGFVVPGDPAFAPVEPVAPAFQPGAQTAPPGAQTDTASRDTSARVDSAVQWPAPVPASTLPPVRRDTAPLPQTPRVPLLPLPRDTTRPDSVAALSGR